MRTWLEPCEPLRVDERALTVGAPDQFAADWNESKHSGLLVELRRRRARPSTARAVRRARVGAHEAADGSVRRARSTHRVRPPAAPNPNLAPLSERYTFEHFVVGKSNELAAAAAIACRAGAGQALQPAVSLRRYRAGQDASDAGRRARTAEARSRDPRITFVGTEQFTNELVGSIQSRTTPDFRRRYRETDLLLVDDVQFLKGKEATQEEFFHTFNAIYEAGRQIILTSDRPPSEIPGLEARLVSRFQWGMVADIALPDVEHRVAILRRKAQLDHLELTIPDDVIQVIADNVRSNVRELEGAIIKLLAYASLKHADITVELAREALRDRFRSDAGQVAPVGITVSPPFRPPWPRNGASRPKGSSRRPAPRC